MVGFVGDCIGVGIGDSGIDSIVGLVGIDSGATEDSGVGEVVIDSGTDSTVGVFGIDSGATGDSVGIFFFLRFLFFFFFGSPVGVAVVGVVGWDSGFGVGGGVGGSS